MIIRDFNNGWGPQFQLRQFEQEVVNQYLDAWRNDSTPSILVNSTWYNRDYHSGVLDFMAQHQVRRVALISFMDPAIVKSDWFDGTGAEIRSVGYYKGQDEIDVWALIVDRYFDRTLENKIEQWHCSMLDTAFLCYNRKPHWHRRKLFNQLTELNCVQQGILTMGHESGIPTVGLRNDVTACDIAPNPGNEQYGIVNDIMSLGPQNIWNRCFLNVVTETVFDVDTEWFVSEKIYKPIIGNRPFLVYAPNGAQSWLRHIGIEPYTLDFSDISDLDIQQEKNIAPFLRCLAMQGSSYYCDKYLALQDKIKYNRNQFRKHVTNSWNKVKAGLDL